MTKGVFFCHGSAVIGAWTMRRILLNDNGYDSAGWLWGVGIPIWHITDGIDSLTVRAVSPVAALAMVMHEGWPPTKCRRYNWEYEQL